MNDDPYDDLIGKAMLVSTVTYFTLGKIVAVMGSFVVMDSASWVGETGKLADCIRNGSIEESELIGDGVMVNLDSATDLIPWAHELPTVNKP